jgi:hypothetical protein
LFSCAVGLSLNQLSKDHPDTDGIQRAIRRKNPIPAKRQNFFETFMDTPHIYEYQISDLPDHEVSS